jgi:hypothetical protein
MNHKNHSHNQFLQTYLSHIHFHKIQIEREERQIKQYLDRSNQTTLIQKQQEGLAVAPNPPAACHAPSMRPPWPIPCAPNGWPYAQRQHTTRLMPAMALHRQVATRTP